MSRLPATNPLIRLAPALLAPALLLAVLGFATPARARTRPHYGGVLRVQLTGNPASGPTSGFVRRLLLDGLTALDASGALRPALAVSWQSDSTRHRFEFHLRPGVRFSDGTQLTAPLAAAALNLACPQACPWSAVRAAGSDTLVFITDAPQPALPALLARDEFLLAEPPGAPGSPANAQGRDAQGAAPQGMLGTGPFRIAESTPAALTLAANESAWQGRPFVDTVEIRFRRSAGEAGHDAQHDILLDLAPGRADLILVPAEQLRQARDQHIAVLVSPPVELLALQLAATGPLAGAQLRASIAAALDRAALANVIFQRQAAVTASLLPPAVSGYGFLFPPDRDLPHALALRGGLACPPLTLAVEASGPGALAAPALQLAAQRLALNLRDAGFAVTVLPALPAPGHPADLTLRRLPIAGPDAAALLAGLLRSAGSGDPAAPPLTATDPASLYKAERQLLEQHTLVPLLLVPRAVAFGPRVRDLQLTAQGDPDLAALSLADAAPAPTGDAP